MTLVSSQWTGTSLGCYRMFCRKTCAREPFARTSILEDLWPAQAIIGRKRTDAASSRQPRLTLDAAKRWRQLAAEYDDLAEALAASDRLNMQRAPMQQQPMQQQQQKKVEDEK